MSLVSPIRRERINRLRLTNLFYDLSNYKMGNDDLFIFSDCWLSLSDTIYCVWIDDARLVWYKRESIDGPISFEEVLDSVSKEVQAKLLFHLDLLT